MSFSNNSVNNPNSSLNTACSYIPASKHKAGEDDTRAVARLNTAGSPLGTQLSTRTKPYACNQHTTTCTPTTYKRAWARPRSGPPQTPPTGSEASKGQRLARAQNCDLTRQKGIVQEWCVHAKVRQLHYFSKPYSFGKKDTSKLAWL